MSTEQLERLTPNASYVGFAGSMYLYAGRYEKGHILRDVHALIWDEPGHVDAINISSLVYLNIQDYLTLLTKEQVQAIRKHTKERLFKSL